MIIRGCKLPNLGDTANIDLIKAITGETPKIVNNSSKLPTGQINYLIIGSVLNWANKDSIVWGAGKISSSKDSNPKEHPKKILAVRGKLTRIALLKAGFDVPEVYSDPFLLMPRFYPMNVTKRFKMGIIPHQIEQDMIPQLIKQFKGCKIIDVTKPVIEVIEDICSCEKIISSALHGIICADAYGVPVMWMRMSNKVIGNGFKYRDYFSSINRNFIAPFAYTTTLNNKDLSEMFVYYSKPEINADALWECCPF